MSVIDLTSLNKTVIAVSGLNTGDNPQPGVPVIRCLRKAGFSGKIAGFVYDAMESGIYTEGLVDVAYQFPYVNSGQETFLQRLDYVLSKTKIDVIIPTLDAEIISYIRLQQELLNRGIRTYLPDESTFNLRDKLKLYKYFTEHGIKVPKTAILSDLAQIKEDKMDIDYPFFVKGRYYEAYKANNKDEAQSRYTELEHKWGLPIIAQELIHGDEFNVVMLGRGDGSIVGMVPQRKLVITEKGKGFGGVVVRNPALDEISRKVLALLKWKGALELELIKDSKNDFHLIEINPRFPAWVRLAEGAGQNLPAALVMLALGQQVESFPDCTPGTMFIRHSEDIISNISTMGLLSSSGELNNKGK